MIYDKQHCDFVYSIYLKPKRCETNSHFHITSNSYKITKSFVKEKTPYILAACIHLTIDFCLTTYQPIYFSYRTAVRSEAHARGTIYLFILWCFGFSIIHNRAGDNIPSGRSLKRSNFLLIKSDVH